MTIGELILIAVALSIDAFAVGLADGIVEPKMNWYKVITIALFFGVFQFAMPLIGFYTSSVFSSFVGKIAPWLSFGLLAFIGGKMIYDAFFAKDKEISKLSFLKLTLQAVATSIDALAVGVSFLAIKTMAQTGNGSDLPFNIFLCAGLIGIITWVLSTIAVLLGKCFTSIMEKRGADITKWATFAGGLILIAIGIKIVVESVI